MTMLATSRNPTVQFPLVAIRRLTQAELPDGAVVSVIPLPAGAIVVGGFAVVETAFDSETSDSIDIGDDGGGGSADPNRYTSSVVDGQAAGLTALTLTGYKFTKGGWVTVENNMTAEDTEGTAGVLLVVVKYVVEGRFNEVSGSSTVPADAT